MKLLLQELRGKESREDKCKGMGTSLVQRNAAEHMEE
jgi:hypothetical protein